VALMAILMLFPIMEVPLFIGYANISILLPVSVIWIMLLNLNKAELQPKRLALISALSIFSVFQARTAAYMIVGCFFGYALYVIVSSFSEKTLRQDFFILCKKFFCIGLFAVLMMSPLFFSFLKHAVTYDIGSAYSAYAMGQDFFNRFISHFEGIGLLIYGIFFVGILAGLKNKNLRTYAVFLCVWIISSVFLFCRIQFMGWQHYCIMILPFAVVLTSFAAIFYSKQKMLGLSFIAILAFNFTQTFFPILTNETARLFNYGFKTPVRYDIEDVKNFVGDLNKLTENSDKKIFLLASGGLYNSTTLQKIYVPERHEAIPSLLNTNDVDLRDGFPMQLFDADFVVIAEPIQVHLRREDHRLS